MYQLDYSSHSDRTLFLIIKMILASSAAYWYYQCIHPQALTDNILFQMKWATEAPMTFTRWVPTCQMITIIINDWCWILITTCYWSFLSLSVPEEFRRTRMMCSPTEDRGAGGSGPHKAHVCLSVCLIGVAHLCMMLFRTLFTMSGRHCSL